MPSTVEVIARREARESRLRQLGFASYTAYLASSRWKSKRSSYWEDPDTLKTCEVCGAGKSLALHHRTYERVGAEPFSDLCPLCPHCHELVHNLEIRGDLDGLDADLGVLVDNEKAAAYREEQAALPVEPTTENLNQRKRLKKRIANHLAVLAGHREKGKQLAAAAAERRLKSYLKQYQWLKDNPTLTREASATEELMRQATSLPRR